MDSGANPAIQLIKSINERMIKGWKDKWKNEWKEYERINERMKEWMKGIWKDKWKDERLREWKKVRMKGRINKRMKLWKIR